MSHTHRGHQFLIPGYGGGFLLSDVEGMLFSHWSDTDALQTEGGDPAGDGDPVGWWGDQSDNANDGTASGTARPTFRANVVSGKPALEFDGIDDLLYFDSNITDEQITLVFVLAKHQVGSGDDVLLQYDNGWISTRTDGADVVGGYWEGYVVSSYTIDTDYHILTVVVRAANDIDFRLDGVSETLVDGNSLGNRKYTRYGATYAGTHKGTFRLAGGVGYSGELDVSVIEQIESYLGSKYGISLPF